MFDKIKLIGLIVLIFVGVGVSTMFLLRRVLVDDMEATYRLVTRIQFQCPDGTTEAIERWGKTGYMRFCKKGEVNDGPWTAWEAQYRNIDGQYQNGKKHGIWTWWNKDGSKYRIIEYREGTETRNELLQTH